MDELSTAIGLVDQEPAIRSSDLKPQDEFLYMLTRRFGLVPKIRYSAALNRGSWFHRRCELFHCPSAVAHTQLLPSLTARLEELEAFSVEVGCDYENLRAREQEDYDTAFSWYDAACQVPLSVEDTVCAGVTLAAGRTFKDFILDPEWRILGTEVTICVKIGGVRAVAQIDLLLYSARTGKLWLVDMKTTAKEANNRLALCTIESQTLYYPRVVRAALPMIIDKFDLSPETTIGGMLHVAISKPDIRMCGKDRDFEYFDTFYKVNQKWKAGDLTAGHPMCGKGIKIGDIKHKKGDFKSREKRWLSEKPNRENFIRRCRDWYLGEGEYVDEVEERSARPLVAISSTPASVIFSETREGWFMRKWKRTVELATRALSIENFPPEDNTLGWGSKDERPYEPFYQLSPAYWPQIIEQNFKVQDRDEKTPAAPSVTVLGANPYVVSSN